MPDDVVAKQKGTFRWPDDSERVAIIGRTGTGKTTAGAYQLSMRSFDRMPWIVIDTKRDRLINSIEGIEPLNPSGRLPDRPGLFIVHSSPREIDQEQLDDMLARVWDQENIGVYFDEGYNVPQKENWVGIQTQGRSKRIPTITLSQRPVDMSRFTWSEADYFQIFWLNDLEDRKAIKRFVTFDFSERLPPFWSYWYDSKQDAHWKMKPVPNEAEILALFKRRLVPDPAQPAPNDPVDPGKRYRVI